jgi:hypothetical protein
MCCKEQTNSSIVKFLGVLVGLAGLFVIFIAIYITVTGKFIGSIIPDTEDEDD